jgi:hypothetical protein
MNNETLVKIILVTTVLVIAIAWGGTALAKSGNGLVDSSQSLLDRLFGREQVVVSGDFDEEALPADSFIPFFGKDVEFEIVIKEFDADNQKCNGFGNYFNVEKQDVGWKVKRIDLPWPTNTIGKNLELIQILKNSNIYGAIELNNGYYVKAKDDDTWWKKDEDDPNYCTIEGIQSEKKVEPEDMVNAIVAHFIGEHGMLEDKSIITD